MNRLLRNIKKYLWERRFILWVKFGQKNKLWVHTSKDYYSEMIKHFNATGRSNPSIIFKPYDCWPNSEHGTLKRPKSFITYEKYEQSKRESRK